MADAPLSALADSPTGERQSEILRELAEIGLDLAREVAAAAKRRLVEARESGWDYGLAAAPGAPFVRLAQGVRRCIALEVHLRERRSASRDDGGGGGEGLFATSASLIRLGVPATLASEREPAAPRPGPAADGERPELSAGAMRETIAADLGPLLDPRERLIEVPLGPIGAHVAEICRSFGLDSGRLAERDDGWVVTPDPGDPDHLDEVALKAWRPRLAEVPGVAELLARAPPNGAKLE